MASTAVMILEGTDVLGWLTRGTSSTRLLPNWVCLPICKQCWEKNLDSLIQSTSPLYVSVYFISCLLPSCLKIGLVYVSRRCLNVYNFPIANPVVFFLCTNNVHGGWIVRRIKWSYRIRVKVCIRVFSILLGLWTTNKFMKISTA